MGVDNLREFAAGLDEEERGILRAVVEEQQKITLAVLSGLVKASPVDTGRFRAGWATSALTPSDFLPEDGQASYPAPDPEEARAAMAGLKPFSTTWISNNLPYAVRLNEGWSKQAPAGFVDLVIAEQTGG